jgi:hypothetical protein
MVIGMGLPLQNGACFSWAPEYVQALVRNITKQNTEASFIRQVVPLAAYKPSIVRSAMRLA